MIPKKVLKVHWLKGPEYPTIRGEQLLEPGLIWVPYIPVFEESEEFRPRRSIKSRYATKVVNNSFYGVVNVNGTE